MINLLYLLVPLIAFLYASVGFGGATGYLAVMSLFGISPQVMASTSLTLNILVAGISYLSFSRAGHLRKDLLLPFLVTSLPAAFLGGYFKVTEQVYMNLLYLVLSFVAVRLLFFSQHSEDLPLRPLSTAPALLIGLAIGLLSGMVGVGGGIFLSPILLFARWATSKQAAAVAAAFIVLNSISGLLGRILGGGFALDPFSLSLLPLGVMGALVGSYYGANRFSGLGVRRALGTVMSFAVTNYWVTFLK